MNKLKIGLLLSSEICNKYIYDLVCWAEEQSDVEISHLIIYSSPSSSIFNGMYKLANQKWLNYLASTLLFRLVVAIEKIFLKFSSLHRDHFDNFNLSEKIKNHFVIEASVLSSDFSYYFLIDDVSRVKDFDLDLLITYGTEVIQGEILHASRLGVISIGSAGNKAYCGKPAGFWECYYKYQKTGFVIESLAEGNVKNILLSGFFPTKYLFSLNQASLYRKINPHLQHLLKQIAITRSLREIEDHQPYSGSVLHLPTFLQSIRYILKAVYRIGIRIIFRIINYQKKWEISFISSNWKKAVLWKSINAKAPRGHFWADPFLYANNDKTYCYVEDYVYKNGRAHISVLEVTEDGAEKIGECIKEPFHLSFPFLFKYAGHLYMCPECSGSKQIRIYRCTEFPLRWELDSVIMDDVAAADTMLFEHAGVWWMLTSIDKSGSNDYCSELYLFSSNSPLSTEWKTHPQNPIRIDSEGGRNAGLLFDEGKIFRLAQRQGYDQYGQGLLMYEITQLSETTYSEKIFSEINPFFKKGILGVHHLSTTGKITVVDHVSRTFFP